MTASPSVWFCTLPRKAAFAALGVALLLAFTLFRPPGTPGPPERDFEAYFAAGATVNAGADPYSRSIWSYEARIRGVDAARDELLPFVGPAATLPFWALLARLGYLGALAAWTGILLCAYIVVLVCALRVARVPLDPLLIGGAAATTAVAAPMLGDFALGQAALVSAAAVAASVVFYRARLAGGALVATLLSAVQPNLALALLGRIRSRWDACIAGAAALTFALITLAAAGSAGMLTYLNRLRAHSAAERFVTIQHTPVAIALSFGAAPPLAIAIGLGVAILAIVATAAVISRERLDPTTATFACCAALPLAVPFFHEHDFVLEILPLLVLALRARGRAHTLAAVAAVLILVDWFGLAQRHAAQGQILCLGFAVAFGFIGLAQIRVRGGQTWAGPITLIVLAAIAVPLAHAHPAPTWPDTLPATYHAALTADASAVWAGEQRAAGLIAVDPIWAGLRSLPLTGCGLLVFALVADHRDRKRRRRLLRLARSPVTPRLPIPV